MTTQNFIPVCTSAPRILSFLSLIRAAIAGRIVHSFRVAARARQPVGHDQPAGVQADALFVAAAGL